ncbi:galactose-specific lectin nattectin-like isoform X1 [Poeciliopsis prolifica]|uniref:galactose-specific lectin nattectin-like isoform X1 n=1 Tax=Poeciliopsis prolifica TaxID=188132 RepID=UPI0024143E88|nr:galactose-specific lectin nattectin-like isoform X1 [Poeciliopsis prolifica]XP_054878102.1 galactose-specific lectin nattectin-like isoform X1 [Poeciliopsis prolifica]
MAAGLLFSLLLGLSFGLWDGADAGCNMRVDICEGCEKDWSWHDGRCFLYVNNAKSWAAAERFCLTMGANLASFHSVAEYNFIRDFTYKATGKHTQTWVGAYDSAKEGRWLWSDGSKFVFNSWGFHEPNNAGKSEHCMDINIHERDYVNDSDCSEKLPFICARLM